MAEETCTNPVYLTLDSGNMVSAEKIAGILQRHHVLATFFVTNKPTYRGDHTLDDSWRDYWLARVKEGHQFASHTWRHWYFRRDLNDGTVLYVSPTGSQEHLTEPALCQELSRINERFYTLTHHSMSHLWRAPGGHVTERTNQFAQRCGYSQAVGWSAAGFLGDELSSERYPNRVLLKRALTHIHAGDILMMHLGIQSRHDPFVNVLEPLIVGLQQKGLCFKPLPTP
ncbi:polysaccharide deacetylase family protein [Ferrovum sp. PN-J185]|nr:polysaccharide deacetylase family protein [Ferrovum sp. PN-J185]MCC6067740.1 polysaccharide deacetylase family protein [Ferrovum sp. PN-J185]MDE1892242.1 polysaccharide deacetylase family protein [Betaproteobacteria bacterium]MDE2056840.1 polysaccharide deacetylase family protein [Betaproteobacteria bacterium]